MSIQQTKTPYQSTKVSHVNEDE